MDKIFSAIYEEVKKIPLGETRSYSSIAKSVGTKAHIVGYALHANKDPQNIPCHRVIRKDGTLASGYAFGGRIKQKKKLIDEGVEIIKNKVDMKKYLWRKTV